MTEELEAEHRLNQMLANDKPEHWSDLLEQDEIWLDKDGVIHRLNDMEPRYCKMVCRFLLRNAAPYLTREYFEMMHFAAGPFGPSGDMAQDCFAAEAARIEQALDNPQKWMQESPLWKALHRRSIGLPAHMRRTEETAPCWCGFPVAPDWDHANCRPDMDGY